MTSLWPVWVPTFAIAHIVALCLFFYSLEQVGGYISKFARKCKGPILQTPSEKDFRRNSNIDFDGADKYKTDAVVKFVTCSTQPIAVNEARKAPLAVKLSWDGVRYTIRDSQTHLERVILDDCFGSVSAGQSVALMGPSGAGKSTLLDLLAEKKAGNGVSGVVLMNGRKRGVTFRRVSAYVPQVDCFVPTLTAAETLQLRAALAMPEPVTHLDRSVRIECVLKLMGLWRSQNTKVGGLLPGGIDVRGLSGGEKRRLSIACALMASPSIIFLDEPTTGLDSFAALKVMDHLAELAELGHAVVASIHQPRPAIFQRFTQVTILSEGCQLFSGPPDACVAWFQNVLGFPYDAARDGNVSDWILDTVSVGFAKPAAISARSMSTLEDVQRAAQAFQAQALSYNPDASSMDPSPAQNPAKSQLPEPESDAEAAGKIPEVVVLGAELEAPMQQYAARWSRQFSVLFKRTLLSQLRNPTDTCSRLLMSTWVGCLAGLVFYDLADSPLSLKPKTSVLFFVLLLYQLLPFCFMSFYVADRKFYSEDVRANLYQASAYYVATSAAGAPFVILNTVCGSLMAYGLSGMQGGAPPVLLYVAIVCLQALISNQLLVLCVLVTPNQDMAYILAIGYVASSVLLGGFWIPIADIQLAAVRSLAWLSFTRYSMSGVSRLEFRGRTWSHPDCLALAGASADPAVAAACGATGDQMLARLGYSLPVGAVTLILVGIFLLFHFWSYLALVLLYKRR